MHNDRMWWRKKPVPQHAIPWRCSFCNRLDYQELIAGPDVFICDECVDVCNDVLAERRSSSSPESRPRSDEAITWPNPIKCALCQTAIRKDDGAVIAGNRGTLCADCVNAVATWQPAGRG